MAQGWEQVTTLGVTFLWLGFVLAISFMEAPLKFRAPGITLPLGLGIGRLVFTALNWVELTLSVVIAISFAIAPQGNAALGLLVAAALLLVTQMARLRPRLDARAQALIRGEDPPRSRLHLAYVVLEIVKVGLLVALAAVLVWST